MIKLRMKMTPLAACLLLAAFVAFPAAAQSASPTAGTGWHILPQPVLATAVPPDGTLFTTYYPVNGYSSISWSVCGSTQQSEGCYSSGSLGPFGHAGAILEGGETVTESAVIGTSEVTRNIYVVDDADGNGSAVKLYVYLKTDEVGPAYDTATVSLVNSVSLPLQGGVGAKTFIAGNDGYLFVGTSKSASAVEIQKSTLQTAQVGGFSPPMNVSSITADKYGYVTVSFGGTSAGGSGFYTFDPNGSGVEDGGGFNFMAGTQNGFSTADLPASSSSAASVNMAARMHVRFKSPARAAALRH